MNTNSLVMESVISYYSEEARRLRWMDAECFPDYEPFEFEGTNWYLMKLGSNYVGYAGWRNIDDYVGELCRAGVLPNWRGNEFQKYMIGFRETSMKSRGVLVSVATAHVDNHYSMNNLIDCGYRTCVRDKYPSVKTDGNDYVFFSKKL